MLALDINKYVLFRSTFPTADGGRAKRSLSRPRDPRVPSVGRNSFNYVSCSGLISFAALTAAATIMGLARRFHSYQKQVWWNEEFFSFLESLSTLQPVSCTQRCAQIIFFYLYLYKVTAAFFFFWFYFGWCPDNTLSSKNITVQSNHKLVQ